MSVPSPEQSAVLLNSARVRVVRSAPGSGKTWLVAELMRREIDGWVGAASGVAALSFTHVGGDEIRRATGHELVHPHFVGTIDAFLFRYVLRPFLQECFPRIAKPRLIPGKWDPQSWMSAGRDHRAKVGKGINLFGCVFIGEEDGEPILAHKPHPASPLRRLNSTELAQVRDAKQKLWERSGFLTHSDAAWWSSKVLGHERLGPTIRSEIVRRYPLIIVDELQDTGFFLGKSILSLLSEPRSRGVLVGDPDQAIFEFNGARPDLFNRFEGLDGATTLPLIRSCRCAAAIAKAASHLKDSGGAFLPDREKAGHAFLVRYDDLGQNLPGLISEIARDSNSKSIKVIARANRTLEKILGKQTKHPPMLGCVPLNHLQRAVILFRRTRNIEALAASQAALELAVFGYEGVTDQDLQSTEIDPNRWKGLAIRTLLSANTLPLSGTVYNWQIQLGKLIDNQLVDFGLPASLQATKGKLKPMRRGEEWNEALSIYVPDCAVPDQLSPNITLSTVHGVKGETHDLTMFVCPESDVAHCPSTIWWSTRESDREEKRIAFVAMTRTAGDLVLCVSEGTFNRLSTIRPGFVSCFESGTVGEFISFLRIRERSKLRP